MDKNSQEPKRRHRRETQMTLVTSCHFTTAHKSKEILVSTVPKQTPQNTNHKCLEKEVLYFKGTENYLLYSPLEDAQHTS